MIPRNYKRGLDWLNDHRAFFTVLVTNLGIPVDDRSIDTACVRLRPGSDIFEFAVNEEFLAPLTDEEVAGILMHESFHILFDHLGDFQDTSMDNEWFRTVAQECICNDNIVDEGVKLPDLRRFNPKTGEFGEGLIYGADKVNRSVSSYTTKEVYELLKQQAQGEGEGDEDGEGGGSGNATGGDGGSNGHLGDLTPEEAQKLKEALQKHIQDGLADGSIKPEDVDQLSDKLKEALDTDQGVGQKAGTEGSTELHSLLSTGQTIEWAKYIRLIDPTAFNEGGTLGGMKYSWHAPRRKIAWMEPMGIRLPNQRPKVDPSAFNGGYKPHLVLALDFSGSIPERFIQIMANLANTVPPTIDVSCCTFSTFFEPYNPKLQGQQKVARGGTNFDAISDFVDSLNLKQYPSVVALTDGQAGFYRNRPDQKLLDKKWNWLLINRYNSVEASNIKQETVRFLSDFVEGLND